MTSLRNSYSFSFVKSLSIGAKSERRIIVPDLTFFYFQTLLSLGWRQSR